MSKIEISKTFNKLIQKLNIDNNAIQIWIDIAYLFEEVLNNEEREGSISALLEIDKNNILPHSIIWDKVLQIDPNNILALENTIEHKIDYLEDDEKGLINIKQLLILDSSNRTAIRYQIVYNQVNRAKESFIKLLDLNIYDCLFYGVFDYFYEDLDFIIDYIPKIISRITHSNNQFNAGYYKSLQLELGSYIK